MNVNTEFEIKAEAFRIMTQHIAPGKSGSTAEPGSLADDERQDAWKRWCNEENKIVSAMLLATERILDV